MSDLLLLKLSINGEHREFRIPPGMRLLDLLRKEAGLTGTKEGCGAGECGACTVLLNGFPVVSCLTLAASCEGSTITTVEGLHGSGEDLRQSMAASGGVQCGFCTPGILMTGQGILTHSLQDEAARYLSGNLCRCTGYVKIFDALERLPIREGEND